MILALVAGKPPLRALVDVTLRWPDGEITIRRFAVFERLGQVPWASLPRLRLERNGRKVYVPLLDLPGALKRRVLHAHIILYGPYAEQERLASVWKEISGNQVAWMQQVCVRGPRALLHLPKYVSKPPSNDPEEVGLLEVAFHGVRRVHALGLFSLSLPLKRMKTSTHPTGRPARMWGNFGCSAGSAVRR